MMNHSPGVIENPLQGCFSVLSGGRGRKPPRTTLRGLRATQKAAVICMVKLSAVIGIWSSGKSAVGNQANHIQQSTISNCGSNSEDENQPAIYTLLISSPLLLVENNKQQNCGYAQPYSKKTCSQLKLGGIAALHLAGQVWSFHDTASWVPTCEQFHESSCWDVNHPETSVVMTHHDSS